MKSCLDRGELVLACSSPEVRPRREPPPVERREAPFVTKRLCGAPLPHLREQEERGAAPAPYLHQGPITHACAVAGDAKLPLQRKRAAHGRKTPWPEGTRTRSPSSAAEPTALARPLRSVWPR